LKIANALVPVPSDAELMGMKPCSLNDVIYMVKGLEYMVPQVPNPTVYYLFIYCKKYFIIGFAPLLLGTTISLMISNKYGR
jgi:hypothetical protein